MCKHMAIRKNPKSAGADAGDGRERDGSGGGRGTAGSAPQRDTYVSHQKGKGVALFDGSGGSGTARGGESVRAGTGASRGRQNGISGRGRRPVSAGTGEKGKGPVGVGTGGNGGRESGGSRGRGGVVTRGRGAVGSPNSTGSPASVGYKRPAGSPIDSVGSKRHSGADAVASTSNGGAVEPTGTVSERTTSASLSWTSIPAQYPSRTLPLKLRSPTPEETTEEVPEEEEDYETPQYEVEEGEEDDDEEGDEEEDEEEEDQDEDEVDAPVPEDQDFDQLLDDLMQLPGREQLTRLSVDPIPPVKSIW